MYDKHGKYKGVGELLSENKQLKDLLNTRDEMVVRYLNKAEKHKLGERVWLSCSLTLLAFLIISLFLL